MMANEANIITPKIKYITGDGNTLTHEKPQYEKWKAGFKYCSSTQPKSRNRTELMHVTNPNSIRNTIRGRIGTCR